MPTRGDALQRAAEREARLQDVITREFADELAPVMQLLKRRIRRLLRDFDIEDGRLLSTAANLGRAMRLRDDLTAMLSDAGFDDVVQAAVDEPLDRLAAKVLASSKTAQQGSTLMPFDVEALTAFKELRMADLFGLSEEAGKTIWRATVDGVMGIRPVDDLVADIEDAVDVTTAEARTLYDTGVSTYSRQVEQLRASGDADELFLYAGPADSKTRKFCKQRVGKVFSRAEIEEMDNGQLDSVMTTGGGFNCRHTWKRVSVLDEELRELHDSGDRLKHVDEQLAEVA